MENLQLEFERIKESHEGSIQSLDNELYEYGYTHTLLNLRVEYNNYVFDLDELFKRYDYIVPYEMYEFFYAVSCKGYNLLFTFAEYVEGSGNLPGAFLKDAINDFELRGISTLLQLERTNDYKKCNPTAKLLSIEAYDALLETQKQYMHCAGYAFDAKEVSTAYATAAHDILLSLGSEVADKAYEYYKVAVDLLKESSGSASYHAWVYYTYFIALYDLLISYKSDIETYGVACDFDIDQEIYECIHENYLQAQTCSRDKMIVQVKNLINRGSYAEAQQIAKEIVDICEERVKNVQAGGVKVSLKNAYELLLNIPELSVDTQSTIREKLTNLLSGMTHEDYYTRDGEREYPVLPN